MLQKWFNGLNRQQQMLVRVVLCFLSALLFWGFYSNVVIEGAELTDYLLFLVVSVLLFSTFLYLEFGRRRGK
ncbi:MAG: hypothetical protein ACE5JK_04260 [Candidatus Omnitrophota bacterium]